MAPEDLYDNVVASLIRFVQDFREEWMPDADYVNFDAHAQLNELPQKDIIGMAGVGFSEDDPSRYEIMCGISVSTWGDPNLARLTKMISKLRGRLIPGTALTVYDHDTAAPDAHMVTITPLAIMPVGQAETRTVQSIEIHLLLDPSAGSSLR